MKEYLILLKNALFLSLLVPLVFLGCRAIDGLNWSVSRPMAIDAVLLWKRRLTLGMLGPTCGGLPFLEVRCVLRFTSLAKGLHHYTSLMAICIEKIQYLN